MMEWAGKDETRIVGCIGLFIFSILSLISLIGLCRSPRVLLTRLFFISSFLTSSLDLPRYILMIITSEYNSTAAYACHISSNYFFFLSLTLVCIVWAHLLQFGVYTSMIYRGYGVITTNAILALISIVTIIFTLRANSLSQLLDSLVYFIYIFFEVIENLIYSVAVAVLGIKLVSRSTSLSSQTK
jgi:lipid-A-disaccharide synthase-like uncharacterized protein